MYTNCSGDGRLVSIVDRYDDIKIYHQDSDDKWSSTSIANQHNKALEVKFSVDSHQIMILYEDYIDIYDRGLGNTWKKQITIICSCGSSIFSNNNRHMLSIKRHNYGAEIYNKGLNGIWSKKLIICHNSSIISAKFSESNKYLVVIDHHIISVYVKDMNDNWMETFQIKHELNRPSATINHDGSQMIIVSSDECMKIYGLGLNGKWTKKASILNHDGYPEEHIFSDDGNYIITRSNIGEINSSIIRIWKPCLTASNKTIEVRKKYIFPYSKRIKLCFFSADDRHIMTANNNGLITIYTLDSIRRTQKKTFNPHVKGNLAKPTSDISTINKRSSKGKSIREQTFSNNYACVSTKLSADSRQFLSIGYNGIAYICRRSDSGYLGVSLIINKIHTAYFSANSRNIIAIRYDNTIKLYRLNLNEEWIEEYKFTSDIDIDSTFTNCSADGRLVSIVDKYNRITIYQQDLHDQWSNTVISDNNHKALEANFSTDSRQVMIINDSGIEIYDKNLDNTWTKQITIICNYSKTVFSDDGRQMLVITEDAIRGRSEAKIYSKNLTGVWSEKHRFYYRNSIEYTLNANSNYPKKNMITSKFNANSNYLMIINDQKVINVYAKDHNENWSMELQINNMHNMSSLV